MVKDVLADSDSDAPDADTNSSDADADSSDADGDSSDGRKWSGREEAGCSNDAILLIM